MDPVTFSLLSLGLSAGSTALGIGASKQQQKLDNAMIDLESESARLQAAQQAYESATGFRQALASQLAISSLRGGSIPRQFAAQSISNMLADQGAFEQQKQFIDVSQSLQKANVKSTAFANNVKSVGSLLGAGLQSINFSDLFGE